VILRVSLHCFESGMATSTRSFKPTKAAIEQFCAVTGKDFIYCYATVIVSAATVTCVLLI
jgi:hypothetical protein